jgi:hypothetical protein
MTLADHRITQYSLAEPIQETVRFDPAVNLTGASLQFSFKKPDEDTRTVLEAVIVSASPSVAAATSVIVRNVWTDAAVANPDCFAYEWKFILADDSVLNANANAATVDFPERVNRSFEITSAIGAGPGDVTEQQTDMKTIPKVVANLTELAALPWSQNYRLVFIESDANGNPGSYWWDETITPVSALVEDPTGTLVVALLDARGGGFRREGL